MPGEFLGGLAPMIPIESDANIGDGKYAHFVEDFQEVQAMVHKGPEVEQLVQDGKTLRLQAQELKQPIVLQEYCSGCKQDPPYQEYQDV